MNPNPQSSNVHLDGTLGVLVWWNLDATQITPPSLQAVLDREGFQAKVPAIKAPAAISRATREWHLGARNSDHRYKAEVTASDASRVVVGILWRTRQDATTVDWSQVAWLEYDVQAGTWTTTATTATTADHDEAVRSFLSVAADRLTYLDHEWIRPNVLMKAIGDAKATCLRRGGGFYFVPRTEIDEMQRLGRIVEAIGNSNLSIATLGCDTATRQSVAREATTTLHEELAEVEGRIAAWEDSARKISTTSQASVLNEIGGLLDRAELYESVLEIKLGDLRERIGSARRTALQVIADGGA